MDPGEPEAQYTLRDLWEDQLVQWQLQYATSRTRAGGRIQEQSEDCHAANISFYGKTGKSRDHKPGDRQTDAAGVSGIRRKILRHASTGIAFRIAFTAKTRFRLQRSFSKKPGIADKGTI